MKTTPLLLSLGFIGLTACVQEDKPAKQTTKDNPSQHPATTSAAVAISALSAISKSKATRSYTLADNAGKNPYFGQTHQHTGWSFDANVYDVKSGPENAFKHARGDKVTHPWGYFVQLKLPLDFMMVSDHAEYLGVLRMMRDPDEEVSNNEVAAPIRASGADVDDSTAAFYGLVSTTINADGTATPDEELNTPELRQQNWQRMITIVDQYHRPGKFTTLAGFEWSSQPNSSNLHRNVIFRDTNNLPEMAFSYYDAVDPQGLWDWMDLQRLAPVIDPETGINTGGVSATLMAIPHNGNLSQGLMYPDNQYQSSLDTSQPVPIDAEYAVQRMRNEQLTEIIQTKGQSETYPDMSPNDEFSGFELWTKPVAGSGTVDPTSPNNYVREAFKRGLKFEQDLGTNPFKYGVIGGGDIHTSIVSHEEYAHSGEHNLKSATPKQRLLQSVSGEPSKIEQGSAGLSCVWAEENTRGDIYDAMVRKETWATSGTRITVRVFAGYDYNEDSLSTDTWVNDGYIDGAPMGGDLAPATTGQTPGLMIWATRGRTVVTWNVFRSLKARSI